LTILTTNIDTKNLTGTTSYLPHFLDNNPLPGGYPWGSWQANDTDAYQRWPETGVKRHYDFTISQTPCAPDGIPMTCYAINGQMPGPLIEANWGDWIEVTLTNALPEEGSTLHWHGFQHKGHQWMDGVPGVSQCPIAPGKSFTYLFQAQLYGSSWYHSHYDAQSANGAFGPIVVYGPRHVEYDEDIGPVILSDWVHQPYTQLVHTLMAPFPDMRIPPSNNNLINGMNPYQNSEGPIAKYQFKSGKSYRLRLINAACMGTQKFTIDGHFFKVIANDFVPIEPYITDHITLAVGQRSDVIVEAHLKPGSAVWMRSWLAPCSQRIGQVEAKAAVYYEEADHSIFPTSEAGPNAYNTFCGNDDLAITLPAYAIAPPLPSAQSIIPITAQNNGTHLLWYLAGRTFRTNYNDPDLLEAKLGQLDFPYIENVHTYGTNSSVIFVVQNTGPMPHPMHLHGHSMFVLAAGKCLDNRTSAAFPGEGDFSSSASSSATAFEHFAEQFSEAPNADESTFQNCWDGHITNPQNPQRRDVQTVLPGEYLVVQWVQDNPGVWPFHCHMTWHAASGFVMSVLERPDDIRKLEIPSVMAQTCRDWAAWTGGHVVKQIDDGL
jgi:FtsP/CotA-like multicopper oxidase with cupredoxin domain